MFLLFAFAGDEDGGVGGDTFLASGVAEALGGGGFYGDVVGGATDAFGHCLLHGGDVGIHLGGFGADGDVSVAEGVASLVEKLCYVAQQFLAVDAFVGRVGVGEMVADVAQGGSAEEGIAEGMDSHVGIAVAKQPEGMVNLHAANPQFAVGHEAVHVKSEAGAKG